MTDSLTVLMKTTSNCPLNCAYCYEGKKSNQVMSFSTLSKIIETVQSRLEMNTDDLTTDYIWHGAEPLMAGIEFFMEIVKIQKKYKDLGHKFKNSVQSSGVLLTEEFADFFVKENFGFGVSLDGPAEIHDQMRKYKSGRPTHKDAMRAVYLMRERGRPPGAICVLTKASLDKLSDIFDFFKDNHISFKANQVFKCGNASTHSDHLCITQREFIDAHSYFFRRTMDIDFEIYNSFDATVNELVMGRSGICCHLLSCQSSFIGFDTDGYALPCSRFNRQQINYGNICDNTIHEILRHPVRLDLQKRFFRNIECMACDYKEFCYSGCMHNSFLNGNVMGKDPWCQAIKGIFRESEEIIFKEIQRISS